MRANNIKKTVCLFCAVVLVVIGGLLGGLQLMESTVFSDTQLDPETKTITRYGVEYFPRQDLTVILLMGIDNDGPVESSGGHTNEGRADALVVAVLNHTDETVTLLNINRDTMVRMPVLGIGGGKAGTVYGQLALSHTYGEGLQDSAENTRDTVSELLYGITIDHYVAMNMDAVAIVNDAVGGVTLEVTDDFSDVDSGITKGEMTLTGAQAKLYVRSRKTVGDQLNLSRMERQEQYMTALMGQIKDRVSESELFALELYEQVADYIVTDCSANAVSGLMQRCMDYSFEGIESMKGRNIRGEEFYEFYPDEGKLDDLVIRLFYAKKR